MKSVTFEVWGQPDNDAPDCILEGTYEFVETYRIRTNDTTEETFDWGFSLNVSS